jgi:hypothetical protein
MMFKFITMTKETDMVKDYRCRHDYVSMLIRGLTQDGQNV